MVNSLKFSMAASLIVKIESFSQATLIVLSLLLKNCSPSCRARTGNCSTTLSLMRQFLSWDSSVRLGMIDCYKSSIPITWFRSSSLLNKFRRTSEFSSLSRLRKMGRMSSLVGPRSMMGQIERMFSARADLT